VYARYRGIDQGAIADDDNQAGIRLLLVLVIPARAVEERTLAAAK
jgi:hypothetical protein